MKQALGALLAVIAVAVAAVLWWPAEPGPVQSAATLISPLPTPVPEEPKTVVAVSSPAPSTPRVIKATPTPLPGAGSPLAAELNSAAHGPEEDVEILFNLLRQYQRRLRKKQGPPIGDDIDLARAMTGRNPMKAVIIPANHPALTADGHLRDRWGTPYFIHPRGYGAFEIRSAGPDRKLFTGDDLVANPARSVSNEALPDDPNGPPPPPE